jgi:polar amino acid transport system substrate-binding protein
VSVSPIAAVRAGAAPAVAFLLAALLGLPADAASLAAVRERGRFHICAHPDALPFSSQDRLQPGLQLEIGDAIARHLGVTMYVDWIVFTRHARQQDCDALIGSIIPGGDAGKSRRPLRLSRPYAGGGYLLVVPKAATAVNGIESLSGKVGVEHTSWPHYLLSKQGVPTSSFVSQTEILEAVAAAQLAGGLVTGPYLGWYQKQHPDAVRPVDSYTPPLDLQWNVAVGLRNADDALVSAVNQAIDRLLADGVIQGIFAKYGIAYVAPRAF